LKESKTPGGVFMSRGVKFFNIYLFLVLEFLVASKGILFSQTQEWVVYTSGRYIFCLADEGNYLWIGTWGGGLVRLNKMTGEFIIYDKWNSGLPDNDVRAIAIDAQGNKWIGTYWGGLAKFDGVNWTVYNTSNSGLPYNRVTAIAIDGQGNKWIGTPGALAKFDGVKWTIYPVGVDALAIDGRGNIWIASAGLVKFDGVNWTVYNTSNSGLPVNGIHKIAIDRQGNVWIGTIGGGLVKFDGINWTVYNRSNSGLPYDWVYEIAIDAQGNKWIGTYQGLLGGGLAKFDGVNWTVYNTSNSGLPDNFANAITIDDKGNKWIGTRGGLVKFDGVNWISYNTSSSGLPDNNIYAIAIDGQGNKWIGTYYGGLVKFDGINWTVYNTSNSGFPYNDVWAITIDGQGNKWIGTYWGLAKFDGTKWTFYTRSNSGLPNNWVRAIAIDSQGNKWIGTYGGGLAKFDGMSWTVYNRSNSGLPSDTVFTITIDGQGNKWIGTYGGGLAKFDGVNWTVYKTSNSGLPNNNVWAIAIDGQGNKWIGTWGGGLAKFDGVNWTVYNTSNSGLPSNTVYAIAIDGQGNKWIGTWGGGLAKFDGVNWTVYNTSNSGLPNNWVNAIAIDEQGNKWIGTDGGGLAVYRGGGVIPLYVSSSQLKFGNVYISDSLSLKLKIKNGGSQAISLNGVSFSRGDVFRVLNSFPINLAPNDSVLLDFVFKPLSSVVYNDTATISTSSGSFKIYLEGRGIRPPYLSGVDSVNFGLIVFGDSLSKSIWVKNTGEIDTVRISKVEVDAPFYVRGVSKFVLRPGDSTRIDLVFKGEVYGYHSSVLRVISNAWNDTLKISLYGAVTPFKQFTSFRQVQSGVVKFVYQVQTTSTFDLKKFEYSTDGVNWVESKNISGSTTITGTKTDTIYWDSKKDLPNFESLNVKVRFTFTGGGFDFPVELNVGVDNKPPSFTGIKGHSFLGFNRVKLLFNRGVDISKFDYIVSFVDTVDRVYRFYKTSLDSVVLGGFYSVAGYVFYVRCVDEFGNVGDSLRYNVKFPAVGDYNFDGKIDAYDLGVFVLGWTNRDSVCDLYPFEGRIPVVRVVGDKKLDAGDVWVFTMFWDRGKRGGFGKVSELSVESLGNERGMNLRYSGGYVTIGFDDFDVSGRFVSGGVEIVYDRGSFRFDSLLFDFDGLKLSYVDSLGGVFYLDFGRGGGFDFERLDARVRFKVLREVKEGMIVKLKLYDEGLKLFERLYRISFEEVPTEYALYQNYPNPFNPTTTIEFDIPEKTNVKLIIYDILGREVETLIDKELEPGKYKINFTATNLPSGVYFYTLKTPKFTKTKKMLLVK
jgi:ligand-binding sensor domain-containing protein